MIKIYNPNNGFIRIESGASTILIDPWVTEGIYHGGWATYPKLKNSSKWLNDATHIFFSHIHEDHFDLKALRNFPNTCKVFIPNVFGWKVMQKKLNEIGFQDITKLDLEVSYNFETFSVTCVPPLNSHGQTLDLYNESNDIDIAIDTAFLFKMDERKLLFMADNFPYNQTRLDSLQGLLQKPDLLFFSYNGLASDYPLCYENIDLASKMNILSESESRREQSLSTFINKISPKYLIPYSSDFFVRGPQSKVFAKLLDTWWASKLKTADHYSVKHSIPSTYLYEDDFILIESNSIQTSHKTLQAHIESTNDIANKNYSSEPLTGKEFAPVTCSEEFDKLVFSAAMHMFEWKQKLHLTSSWKLILNILDWKDGPHFEIDLESNKVKRTDFSAYNCIFRNNRTAIPVLTGTLELTWRSAL